MHRIVQARNEAQDSSAESKRRQETLTSPSIKEVNR
jgi:hypothetical protein